jgi:hypothetical protein
MGIFYYKQSASDITVDSSTMSKIPDIPEDRSTRSKIPLIYQHTALLGAKFL